MMLGRKGSTVQVRSWVRVLAATEAAWMEALDRLEHDVFHRPDYHALPEFGHQGTPHLFSFGAHQE